MNRFTTAKIVMALLFPVHCAAAEGGPHVYSNYEAAEQAKDTLRLLDRLWKEGSDVCRLGEREEKLRISTEATRAKRSLSDRPEGQRAFAPYWSCALAADDIAFRMRRCANAYTTAGEMYSEDEWKTDRGKCESAIVKPDLSLIQP